MVLKVEEVLFFFFFFAAAVVEVVLTDCEFACQKLNLDQVKVLKKVC